jgi:hypothetical protein
MNTIAVARIAALVFLPVTTLAQTSSESAEPPSASPPLRYESVIDAYRPMDDKIAPAKGWRSANELVRDTGSMSGMSMGDESGDMKGMDHGAMKGMQHEEAP